MIHVSEKHLTFEPNYSYLEGEFPFISLDSREEFDILCPVSVVTGHRSSLQDAMLHLTEGNIEMANNLIQNLDSSYSDERLSVNERLDLVKQRLLTGSFAENDLYLEGLREFIELNYPENPVAAKVVEKVVESQSSKKPDTVEVEPNT